MSVPDLETRLRSHYQRYRPDNSTRLVLASGQTLDDLRRTSRARPFWRAARLVTAVAAVAFALVALGLVVSSRGAPASTAGLAGAPDSATPAVSASEWPTAVGTGALPNGSASASMAAASITKEAAVQSLAIFLGRKLRQVTIADLTSGPTGSYYQIMETPPTGVVAWVDAATGRVIYLLTTVPETTNVKLTPAQAQAAAETFFKVHDISIDGLTPTVRLEDHGCCKLYSVEWDHIVNGVTLPDSRLAQVDPATGNVLSFSDRRVPYGPLPSPKIARDEAVRLATAASGLTSPKLEDAHLMLTETSSPVWGGRLVWSVQLSDDSQGYVSAAWVYVDAVTGETVIAGRG